MSFPAYDEYKETDDSFLGDVPEQWLVTKLGFLCRKVGSGKTPKGGSETYVDDGVLFIRSQNVYDEGLRLDDVVYISEEVDEEMAISRVERGDILLNITGASLGRTCLVADNIPSANVNQHVCIIRLKDASQREFVAMAMKAFLIKSQIDACQNGAAREGLNFEQIGQLRLAIPPEEEQKAISSFLDVETSKIDGLVSEQRRLIELLKEKRQAVISHAVTKGLNPNVPMKPSGIQWLGDVPQHWKIGPIKRFFDSLDGRRIPLSSEERSHRSGEFPYYGASGIIDWVNDFIFEEDLVLVSEDGANLLNRSSPISFVATGQYWVNNHAHILKPSDQNLHYWAERIEAVDLVPFVTGAAQPKFTADALMNLRIAVPPTESERREIQSNFLKAAEKLDTLLAEAERAIELLQERRTALISAAVTGKIDVRNYQSGKDT